MIDVVYSPNGNWGLALPWLVAFLVITIGSFAIYIIIVKFFKKYMSKKAQNKIATIMFFVYAFTLMFTPLERFITENKNELSLSKSQYETVLTGSILGIQSKDPKLKTDKMYFRIKKGSATQFVERLEASPLDEQNLIVYVKWSDHHKNSTDKVVEVVVSKESLNLQEE